MGNLLLTHVPDPMFILSRAKLAWAAGFPKGQVLKHVKAIKTMSRHRFSPSPQTAHQGNSWTKLDEFVKELKRIEKNLQERCRDVVRVRLMTFHPETNLFCLVPQLPIPVPIENFLLYDVKCKD